MEGRKSKEISVLSKQLEEESKKGRQNEFKLEGLRKKLDKKTEEIGLLSKRIKDQQFLNQPHKTSRKNSLDKLMDEDTDANSIMSTVDDSQEFDNGKKHELLIGAQEELNEVREQISEIENRIATVEDGSVDMQELKKQNSSLILRAAEIRKEITSLQHSSKDTSHGRHKKVIGILPMDFSKLINHIPDDEHLQSLINRL
ncbi:hypothetical protein BC833DRAFT_63793 [Globomyces pollinis-pini]|nr:hypothetical protein BC833DRAFT_63793 [Globomyces pollinis-pini]